MQTETQTPEEARGWSNSAELHFIEGLAMKKDGANLLRGYLAGHQKRANFGAVDPTATRELAKQLLADIEKSKLWSFSKREEVA